MKILMICTEKLPVPPVLGGAIQTYISGVLPYLSKIHEITVLGVNHISLPEREDINNVHYVRIPGDTFHIYQEGVTKYLETTQYDLIHIYNRPRLILPVRNVAPHSKIILSMHNDMFNTNKIDVTEAKEALNEISKVVTVSNYIGNEIKRLFPEDVPGIQTIYAGVDTERFLPGNHPNIRNIRKRIREENNLEEKTVILFAGRLSHNKGVDKLILALPELATKFKDLALVIVGAKWFSQNEVNDYVGYVRALAKKLPIPVVNTGFVSPSEIQNWFAAADLFVCTSQWQEPLARVHYESMAAGLPIVTTARGGNPEVIFGEENGLVVENPENPANFAKQISRILSDKKLMKKMSEKGRDLAVTSFTWDRVANDILQVWNEATLNPINTNKLTTSTFTENMESIPQSNKDIEKKDKKEKEKKKKKEKVKEKYKKEKHNKEMDK